jgi:outer membrane protein
MENLITRGRLAALAFALGAAVLATPAVGATDVTDIGTLDQSVLASIPAFQSANKEMTQYGEQLQQQYVGRARHASQADQAKLAAEFQAKMTAKQRQVLGPLMAKAKIAVASVASSRNLSVVLDKRIVVVGGTNITENVRELLTGIGDPVPPVSTPGPSTVGFVDQNAIDQTPKVKSATDDFMKFKAQQDQAAAAKLKTAHSNSDRDTILRDYRKTLDDHQSSTLKPIVDQTRDAIAAVAKQKGLILVVDASNIIYGGTDITADVTAKLK